MEAKKKVRDVVIPLTNYPHMPYWASLREAIVQLNVAFESGHHAVLVFDEAYKLVGILLQNDILRGLEPRFAEHYKKGNPIFWNSLLQSGSEKRLARPLKEFMSEARVSVDADDGILKASHLMLSENACLLPVVDGGKLVGVVRMSDIFQQITNALLKL